MDSTQTEIAFVAEEIRTRLNSAVLTPQQTARVARDEAAFASAEAISAGTAADPIGVVRMTETVVDISTSPEFGDANEELELDRLRRLNTAIQYDTALVA